MEFWEVIRYNCYEVQLGIKPRKFDSRPHIVRVTFLSTFDVPIKRTVISDKSDYL